MCTLCITHTVMELATSEDRNKLRESFILFTAAMICAVSNLYISIKFYQYHMLPSEEVDTHTKLET